MPAPVKPPASAATGEFGRRVRVRRHELGLSQERLAEGSALHWSYIGQVERGQTNPTLHSILRISKMLDVDPGELVAGLTADD
jgi:transcriptional regulator with XRE-family HTH domain